MAIGSLIKTIQDIMRKDVGVDGDAQRISQIVWLIFLKIFDDKEQEWEFTISGYKSPLPNHLRWSSWAKNSEGMTGEELLSFVNNDLFPELKKLATAAGVSPHGRVVGAVFEDAYNYMKSGTLLRQVINCIESVMLILILLAIAIYLMISTRKFLPICNLRVMLGNITRPAL